MDQIEYNKLFDDSEVISEGEILRAARDFRDIHTEDEVREAVRTFESGATRDTDDGKLDYEGFLSPVVLKAFAEYMHSHRTQSDGTLRDSDNWQKGIPLDEYMKSMWRHFMEVWELHRRERTSEAQDAIEQREALCALLFNVMGYLYEELKNG